MEGAEKVISFLHSGDMGDIVAGMAAVKEYCEANGAKARIVLNTDGAWDNPMLVRGSRGLGMKFGTEQFKFLAPLLRAQPYVCSVEECGDGEKADIDLNEFRKGFSKPWKYETFKNLLYCHQKAIGLKIGYRGPWLTLPDGDDVGGFEVGVCRSGRYHSSDSIYKKHMDEIRSGVFVGTEFEYDMFLDCFRFRPGARAVCNDAAYLARAIFKTKTFFVNGTLAYWIALGLGHPHIVHEVGVNNKTTVFMEDIPGLEYAQGSGIKAREAIV